MSEIIPNMRGILSSQRLKERWKDPVFREKMLLRKGKPRSEEAKKKMSQALELKWQDPAFVSKQAATRLTPEYREHQRQRSLAREFTWSIPEAHTELENRIEDCLRSLELEYENQFPIDSLCADFFLPHYNLAVEGYGCYWHGCSTCFPERGRQLAHSIARGFVIRSKGYLLFEIWECQSASPEYLSALLQNYIVGVKA